MVMLNAENAHSEDDFSGQSRPVPGKYHCIVNNAEEKGSKKKGTPGLECEFQVLTGTVDGQAGKTIPLFMSYVGSDDAKTKTCIDRVTRLALCCGILRPGEAKEPDWSEAIGRELVIEIEEQEYPDKDGQMRKGSSISFMGFWSLGNAAVKDVPRDMDSPGMLALARANGVATAAQVKAADKSNGNMAPAAGGTAAAGAGTGKAKGKYDDL